MTKSDDVEKTRLTIRLLGVEVSVPFLWGVVLLVIVGAIAWLGGYIPPGRTQVIEAQAFSSQRGVEVGGDPERKGMVWTQGDAAEGSSVVYDFWSFPCANRMFVEYASGQTRPVRISLNGATVFDNALSRVTGRDPVPDGPAAYYLDRRERVKVGGIALGFRNSLEVETTQGAPLPHLVRLIFVCSRWGDQEVE